MRRTTIPSETTAFVDGRIVRTNVQLRLPSRDLHSHVYFAPILGMLISNSTADSARFREALHWLQITADSGWPQYPMMERDRMLDPVRRDPAVARFLAALKLTFGGTISGSSAPTSPENSHEPPPAGNLVER